MPKGGLPQGPPSPPPDDAQGPPMPPDGGGPPGLPPGLDPTALPPDAGGDDPNSDVGDGGLKKLSQGLVVYMGAEDGPFECGHCLYFAQPSSCHLVDGDIDPKGCCNLYTPSGTSSDQPDAGAPPDQPPPDPSGPPVPPQG